MAAFTDNQGREWLVVCNVASIERAKDATGVNLCDLVRGELYDRLDVDCVLVAKLLAAICRPELHGRQVAPDAFIESIQGDPTDAGREAILDAMADFFPTRHRNALSGMRAMAKKLQETGSKSLEAFLASESSASATSSLEFSDSTRGV